jgi:hypothetical protein
MDSTAESSVMNQQPTSSGVGKRKWGKIPEARGYGHDETSIDASAQTILEQVWDGLPDLCEGLENLPKRVGEAGPELNRILENIAQGGVARRPDELLQVARNPLIVNSLRDLMYHVGLWFYLMIGGQTVSALLTSQLVFEHSSVPWGWIFGAQMGVAVLANAGVYLMCRGRLYRDFLRPSLCLVLFTVVPGILMGFGHFMRDLAVPG